MASSSTSGQIRSQPENAFDGLGPYSAPKSTEPWDIFINHRGSDVKFTLAKTIHDKLHSLGFHVFLDVDALDAGDSIPAEIQHAMATATLHIAIFSPSYAQSPWCLAELSFMLQTGKTIIPIFYRVDPSDLRWVEKGKYADAFSEHESKGRYTIEKLDEWKGALHNTSFLSGYLVNSNEDEATVLKNIVNRALAIMEKTPLWVAEHPQGLDELVQGFESLAIEETVKIRGIVGMGGSGKTTLAKELFNRNFSSFQKCSFVFDVRDAASRNALPDKQKRLLADLDFHYSRFDHVDEGKVVLANHLSSRGTLIVLDDVDHIEHLNALLPSKNNLGSQSMVIVTTREMGVLLSWGISPSSIFEMRGLNRSHAEQLFCWHAFLQPSPPAEFQTLVQDFVKACNALPLSLKVLGAQLYGRKSAEYWKSQLHKILRILPSEIKQRLQVSYNALDEEEREMFLDVACFLIGEEEGTAIAVWDGSGWSGLFGLETLVNKCLVELVEENVFRPSRMVYRESRVIRMHDHLRDMGREIASKRPPYRLWCPQQIDKMKLSTKRNPVRGILPVDSFVAFKEYTQQLTGKAIRRSKRLRFSYGLQILSVKANEFTEDFASLSQDLVWLRWEDFPLRNFPSWFALKNLKILEIIRASKLEELWQDDAEPPLKLSKLILTGSGKLQRFPRSLRRLRDLKRLAIELVASSLSEELCALPSLEDLRLSSLVLSSLPDGFGNLINLKKILLYGCKQLSMLPGSFSQLIHLTDLDLSHCEMLSSLPDGFGSLTSLKKLRMIWCLKLSTLPDSFSQLRHLTDLDLSYCEMLSSLPDGFGSLTSLKKLRMFRCWKLSMLPDSFSQLRHLTDLDLSHCEMLSSLPDGFGSLMSLKKLRMIYCWKLSMLPDSFSQLRHLTDLDLSRCQMLSSLPDGFGSLTSLKKLRMTCCLKLSMLPDSFSQLRHLTDLDLSHCKMLSSLPDGFGRLRSLKNLCLRSCSQLKMLPDSFRQLIHLTDLNLSFCKLLPSFPDGFGNLTSLRRLDLSNCSMLSMLPDSFNLLINLIKLELSGCELLYSLLDAAVNLTSLRNLYLKDSFTQLIHLEILNLSRCDSMSSLPDGFGNLTSMRILSLSHCKQLTRLPDSFSQLIQLENLRLSDCEMLSSLPEMLPVSLNELRIFSCNSLKNVRCIGGLINLETLEIGDCLQIEELPSFTDLVSLKKIKMFNCPKVEKIQGLEHAKSLKELTLKTSWKEAGIQSLGSVMERLEVLKLECETISALKPCIQSAKGKECAREVWIKGSAIRSEEPIVIHLAEISNLDVFKPPAVDGDSDDRNVGEIPKYGLVYAGKSKIPNDVSHNLYYVEKKEGHCDERKVVCMCYTEHMYHAIANCFPPDRAIKVSGKREGVLEAFYQLLQLLE